MDEFKRIVTESEVMKEDDNNWPAPDRVGRQELEVRRGRRDEEEVFCRVSFRLVLVTQISAPILKNFSINSRFD